MNIDNIISPFNDESTERSFNPAEVSGYKLAAVVPYLIPILFFLPLVMDNRSNFNKFHANQQLTWLAATVCMSIVGKILGIVPILGGIMDFVLIVAWLAITAGLMYGAAKGKALKLPFIGDLIKLF